MNKNVANALSFVLGGGLGAFIAYKVCKKKYEQISKEEIESIKKRYIPGYGVPGVHSGRYPWGSDEKVEADTNETVTVDSVTGEVTVETHKFDSMFDDKDDDRPNMIIDRSDVAKEQAIERAKYANVLKGLGYAEPDPSEFDDPKYQVPYIITPDEFGEKDGYDIISLTYYHNDGVLADDMDERIDDYEDIIGKDALDHFGDYEDDSVFVRNDRLKADYEILLDDREYFTTFSK